MEKVTGFFGAIGKAFKNLTKREQVMVYGLVVVVVLAVLIFLIILPALSKLSTLTDEVSELQLKETEMRITISQTDAFKVRYEDANKNLTALKKQFFLEMDPESLDETITALIVEAGLAPKDLQMTSIQQGLIPEFISQPLDPAGMPTITTGEATGTPGAATPAPEDTAGMEAPQGPDSEAGTEAFVYTVAARANGDKNNLSRLIDIVNDTSGIELNSYRYSLIDDVADAGALTEVGSTVVGGSVEMEFYVYVYIDITSGVTYTPIGEEATQ